MGKRKNQSGASARTTDERPHLDPYKGTPSNVMKLSGIPHGFFEQEIAGFFSQFGTLQKIRVSRDNITGRSKGYAFVQFKHANVAKIAAEAMDNYILMEKKLQCKICSEEWLQTVPKLFRDWERIINPKEKREWITKKHNLPFTTETYCKQLHKLIQEDRETRAEILKKGIDYDYPRYEDMIPIDSPYHAWLKSGLVEDATGGNDQSKDGKYSSQYKKKSGSRESETVDSDTRKVYSDGSGDEVEEELADLNAVDISIASSEVETEESIDDSQLKTQTDQSADLEEGARPGENASDSFDSENSEDKCENNSTPQVKVHADNSKSKIKRSFPASKRKKVK